MKLLLAALAACLLSGAITLAQSFNVDLHGPIPATIPSPAYGAAASQPGVWNAFSCLGYCAGNTLPLVDLAGLPTSVVARAQGGGLTILCPDPVTTGDDEALLESGILVNHSGSAYVDMVGLTPGTYDLYGYAYSGGACSTGGMPVIAVYVFPSSGTGGYSQSQFILGTGLNGGFVDDLNYGRTRFRVASGEHVTVHFLPGGNDIANGFQLVLLPGNVHPYCFGTNEITTHCPCGASAWELGCPSSFGIFGAGLTGTGNAQVSADGLQLTTFDVSNSVVTLFQGTQIHGLSNGTVGVAFGDGLRCAGGTVVRIASKSASLGSMTYPEANELPISVRGGVPPAGGFRMYQVWYRNAAMYCTSSTFNLTNGVAVDWAM